LLISCCRNLLLWLSINISCIEFTIVEVVFDAELIELGLGHSQRSTVALVTKQSGLSTRHEVFVLLAYRHSEGARDGSRQTRRLLAGILVSYCHSLMLSCCSVASWIASKGVVPNLGWLALLLSVKELRMRYHVPGHCELVVFRTIAQDRLLLHIAKVSTC